MRNELKHILVVDDEEYILEMLDDFLTFQGYAVTKANSGAKAMEKIAEMQPQVVIMDIKMPGLSGLEVLSHVKDQHKDTFVIMLSAFGDMATIISARNQGADFYLQKPVDLKQLQKILSTWKNPADEVLE